MNGFIYRGSMTFLPTLIKEQVHVHVLGIDQAAMAGSLTTFALLTGGIGQYLGGRLSDRVPIERLAMQITIIVVPTLLLVGIGGGLLVVVAASAFVFFNFSGQPVFNSLLAEYVPGSALGRGYGLSFFASFGLGSVAATFAGFMADRWGTSSVFLGLAAFSLLTAALAAALWRLSTGGALPRAVPEVEAVAPLTPDDA
jgi:MFS family permease